MNNVQLSLKMQKTISHLKKKKLKKKLKQTHKPNSKLSQKKIGWNLINLTRS